MKAEIFAEWLRRQGVKVAVTESSFWYEAGAKAWQAFPYHCLIEPSEKELRTLLTSQRGVVLRYSTPISAAFGSISYHAVLEEEPYCLEALDRRSRQNVRTGLKNCIIEPVSFERLAKEGWALEMDTSRRQGRRLLTDRTRWEHRCRAAADLPGFEAWGGFVEGELAASLLSFQMEDCCELISQQCSRRFLSTRVNNALIFTVSQLLSSRPQNRMVFYTLQSLDAPASVDDFKFRMGYHARPVRQRVVFHPWAAPFAGSKMTGLVHQLSKRWPENPLLAKAAGMLRFHQNGLLPLDEQVWPNFKPEKNGNAEIASVGDGIPLDSSATVLLEKQEVSK